MPTLAQSVLPFECSVCGIEVTSTETNPHLSRRQCGRCKQRAYYAASVGKSVDELRSKKLGEHPDSVSRPAVVPMERLDCEQCGTPFVQRRRTQRNCSKACWTEAHKNRPRPISSTPCRLCGGPRDSRKHLCSGCLDDPQVWRACGRCGTAFMCAHVSSSERREVTVRKYCSDECRTQSVSEALSGKGQPPNATCEWCSEPFAIGKQASKRFCSKLCMGRADAQRRSPPTVTVRCAWCDKQCQQRAADVGRYRSGPFCDKRCQMAYIVCVNRGNGARPWPRTQPCVECGVNYPTSSNTARRCPSCAASASKAHAEAQVVCMDCGAEFVGNWQRKRCRACERKWKQRHNRKTKDNRHLKRRAYIIKRDHGRCQVCKCKVKLGDPLHPRAAEIDHIIPRSLWPAGLPGKNDPANLRLLCRTCNNAKSNGTAPRGDQLMLVG